MKYFSEEKVNTGRQPELDLMKALCIIGMIVIHVLLDLGSDVLPETLDNYGTEFLGAANFMLCMGIGLRYSRNQSVKGYLLRGFALLTVGQFLNLLRNALPNLIAYWILEEQWFIANALLVIQSDILSFAGLALFLFALLKKLKVSDTGILIIGIVLSLFSLFAYYCIPSPENYLLSQLAAYFVITDAEAYFPLFCYFIFIAFGSFIGGWYPRIKDKDGLSNRILCVCLPIAVAYYAVRIPVEMPFLPELGTDLQYNMKPTPDALATCLTSLIWLALFYKITKLFKGKLPEVLMNFSTYINSYYCVSYVILMPVQTILIATTGALLPGKLLPWVCGIALVVICYIIVNLNEKYLHWHISGMKGKARIIFVAAVWAATILVVLYAYPRITEYANIWNDYLLP